MKTLYYDTIAEVFVKKDPLPENDTRLQYRLLLPVVVDEIDTPTHKTEIISFTQILDVVYAHAKLVERPILELRLSLYEVVMETSKKFQQAFDVIDSKAARSDRAIVLAFAEGSVPKILWESDTSTLEAAAKFQAAVAAITPEQEKNLVDLGVLYELEEVAKENRRLLSELNALAITEDMTLEQAQNVVHKACDIHPWLPWNTQNIAATGPTQPENT